MSTRRIQVGLFSAVLVCLAFATGASAQQPAPTFPYDSQANRPGKLILQNAVKSQELPTGQNLKKMEDFIVLYSLPQLTLAVNLKRLPETRDLIRRDLYNPKVGAGPAINLFNEKAMATLTKMLNPAYKHKPVVRYNVVILIGELDQVVGKKGTRKAVPYTPALAMLTKWTRHAKVDDFLKVAALRGVLRHAEAGIRNNQEAGKVQVEMLALLGEKVPTGRSPKVHAWMRRRAADVLGAMGSNGKGDLVAKTLVSVMRNAAEPLLVRGTVAAALGQLPLAQVSGLNAAQLQALKAQMKQILDQTKALGATAATPLAAKPAPKP